MDSWDFVRDLVLLLAAALAVGAIFERLKQSALIGYLLAGTLLGPGGFRLVQSEGAVHLVAELGVALLLFTIGLEFSFGRLKSLGRSALLGGLLQMVLTIVAVTALGMAMGWSFRASLVAGTLIAPSSTACVLRVLMEQSELESLHGRLSLGILLFQDLCVIPLVVLITILGEGGHFGEVAKQLGKATLAFASLVGIFLIASIYIMPRLLNVTALTRNRELPVLLAVSVCLAATWAAHAMGVSPSLGAFVAGLMLAGSPFATQLRADVSTVRVLFATLFFVSVGMVADVPWMAHNWSRLLLFLPIMLALKIVVIFGVLRFLQPSSQDALCAGICLAQGGEFGFVLGLMALDMQIVSKDMLNLLLSSALLSMFITPTMVRRAPGAAARMLGMLRRWGMVEKPEQVTARASGHVPKGHVIVVGFGPAGRQVQESLAGHGVPVTVLEMNMEAIEFATKRGIDIHFGDATNVEVLEHHGLAGAAAVIVTIPTPRAVLDICNAVRTHAPGVPVVARVRQHRTANEIDSVGALVVDEEEEVGRVLARTALKTVSVAALSRSRVGIPKLQFDD